ncbi:MAG: hypothetical protein K8823_389 [Cenarchaeum symbiont of Oopsacas minuta]|nr:hypothetical protein [Cenarchaeum symbiont of Oopsacas minuta]
MSWVRINMKFPGKCLVCNQTIAAGQVGFWAQGIGVKHEDCAQIVDMKCMVCKGSAGCSSCEFMDSCNPQLVSQTCICAKCSNSDDPLLSYLNQAAKEYPALNLKI